MKSEIILQGENKTILLTPENNHEKFFIEKTAILKDSKSFDVDFRFEQRRVNSIDGITFNHCIIISNEKEKSQDNFPFVIDDAIEKESNQFWKQHLITVAILFVLLLLGYFVSNFPYELVGFTTFIFLYIATHQLVKTFF